MYPLPRNLGFVFDEHLTFHLTPSPNLAIIISDSLAVSILTSIPPQLAPMSPPSFTPHFATNLYYNLPKYQITRIQHIQNSFALAVIKAPKSCHITPIL